MSNLPVVSAIPQLADVEDLDSEGLEKINRLFRIMTSSPAGVEHDVDWTPDKLRLRHPITSGSDMPQEAQIGDLYANGQLLWSNQNDGAQDPFRFVPCYIYKSRARFPQGASQPDCQSEDLEWNNAGTMKCEDCPDLPFRDGNPTACNDTINVLMLPITLDGVYMARFSKSSYRAGKNIINMLASVENAWDRMFGLSTKERTGENYTWYVYQTRAISDEEVPPEVRHFAQFVNKEFKASREEYLANIEERRKMVQDTAANLGDDAEFEDDPDFSDSM